MELQMSRLVKWAWRMMALVMIVSFPAAGGDPEIERLYGALPAAGCAEIIRPIDHAGVLESLNHAYAFNKMLDRHVAAVNHDYFTTPQVLAMVEGWTPQITCVAQQFDIAPELLAGIMALELDLDYHTTDAVFDSMVVSPVGDTVSEIEVGAAYAGVHFKHLKPVVAEMGKNFSSRAFYLTYYGLIMEHDSAELTELSTRHRLLDLTNGAVMARYYAKLRMGNRSLSGMTVNDMAFTWSAYRGGVVGSTADAGGENRWSLEVLQKAENLQVFGDTLIAVPYFTYFRELYGGTNLRPIGVKVAARGGAS